MCSQSRDSSVLRVLSLECMIFCDPTCFFFLFIFGKLNRIYILNLVVCLMWSYSLLCVALIKYRRVHAWGKNYMGGRGKDESNICPHAPMY